MREIVLAHGVGFSIGMVRRRRRTVQMVNNGESQARRCGAAYGRRAALRWGAASAGAAAAVFWAAAALAPSCATAIESGRGPQLDFLD